METTEHGARVVYPIQFIEQEALGRLPIPLVRVSLCGMIKLEVLIEVVSSDPPLGRYQVIAPHILRGRGAVPSLMLLKLLGSQPHRFAPKDWLATQMKHEMERGALVRLDTIASQLRKQFRGYQGQEANALGLLLVSYLRNGRGSGPGYQLAPYPLIWLDTEALAFHVEQAARMERFGQSQGALPFWQRAYALASRGEYLPDDLYSEWAADTRAQVQGALRQSVHALSRLSLSLHGQQGKEEVIALLRNYWLAHQSDEDALRPLMELLGERERYQEAEGYYQQLCEALDAIESGKQPDERTRDIREFLRARQIQRPPVEEDAKRSSSTGQQQTQVVEATGYPLSDDQQLLLVADEHSEHTGPLDAETRHLLGRQEWLASVLALIEAQIPKKLLVLHGPIGVGKSSELNRLAHAFREQNATPFQVMVLPLPSGERHDPEVALDLFLGMLLSSSRAAPFPADASRQMRIKLALTALAQRRQPTVILLDNAEGMLTEEGTLAPCWEAFLTCCVRGQHQASFVLATKEWPGWSGRDSQLVAEIAVPPLTLEDSVLLLQRLGLESVPHAALEMISQRVACIPLCLEWIATIAHDPLVHDEWEGFEEQEESSPESRLDAIAQRLARLLHHPSLLEEHLASRLTPLLEHIIERHLSADARRVLQHLTMVSIPLGKPALQVLCPRPALLKELRDTSLLVAYTNRVQLLPVVALTVRQQLSSAQRHEGEVLAIQAYTRWLDEGNLEMREAGSVVTELAVLLLMHHRLLEAAELVLYHGWCSFQQGYAQRLARLVEEVLDSFDWQAVPKTESGGLLLHYFLMSHLGLKINEQERVEDHQRILEYVLAQQVAVESLMEVHIIHILMLSLMNEDRFEQAQRLLEACVDRMEALLQTDFELHAMLLSKRGWLFGKWSGHAQAQGCQEEAQHLLGLAIECYEHSIHLLRENEQVTVLIPLRKNTLKKKLAVFLNSLSNYLNRIGKFEEALEVIEQCITLQEQGYVDFGGLAASHGEKSEILAKLGRFQEALHFDEKARAEIQRCVDTGDAMAQEQARIYQVNQGRLYLRLGRIDEAEKLLREAQPHIAARRKIYRLFAKEALMEIEQMRGSSRPHQLDWRWVQRYRELDAYDAYWWWAYAGPFTKEEQRQWEQLFSTHLDETARSQLGVLLARSRDREVEAGLAEHRNPRLRYPALDIEEVRRRIAGFFTLDAEIARDEPNAIVRRLYHGTIEDELCFIRSIEATQEGNSEHFWELNKQLNPLPTHEEMEYVLSRLRQVVLLGLQRPDTVDVSERLIQIMHDRLHLSLDRSEQAESVQPLRNNSAPSSAHNQRLLSARAAKRFFEVALQEADFDGWSVLLDPNASTRVDAAMKVIFLPDEPMTLETVRDYFVHELLGHVSRSVAGEHSLLGLLGMNTKGYAPTEEGLAHYHERTVAALRGEAFDDSGPWLGGLAVGLASGVVTPPQTFFSLFTFFEPLLLLYRLMWRGDEDRPTAEKRAHNRALMRCLRTFRGVPDLERVGICNTRDVVYLRGCLKVEQAVAQDEMVLDRLAVGKVALELLPDVQELGIITPHPSLRKRAYDPDLDTFILSFEDSKDSGRF